MEQGIAAIADGPMTIMDDADSNESPSKKIKYAPKRLGHQVVEIKMHERPTQCAGSAVAGTRKVRVLARSTNQLWIAVDDVGWLIHYVSTEVALGGAVEIVVVSRHLETATKIMRLSKILYHFLNSNLL